MNKNRIVLFVLLLLLLISLGTNFYLYQTHNQIFTIYKTRVDTLKSYNNGLESQVVAVENELNTYKGISEALDSTVNAGNAEILLQKEKILQLIAKEKNTAGINEKLKVELDKLQKLKDDYIDKIELFITDAEHVKLKNQLLETTVQSLIAEKKELETKLDIASQLKCENLKIKLLRRKKKNKFVETAIAKRINKFNVCFTILENKFTKPSEKTVYLRIVAPDGKAIGDRTRGSARFYNLDTNSDLLFTKSIKLNYTNENINQCIEYEESQNFFVAGNYLIEVYIDGIFVQKTNVMLL